MNGTLYGSQPPTVPEQKLLWVVDQRDRGRGPALHFQTAYDKIVIFEGSSFPSRNIQIKSNQKRHDTMPADQGPHNHRFANSPGETPWYCIWNQTYIEGFVYIQQPVHGAETQQYTTMTNMVMTTITSTKGATASIPSSQPTTTSLFGSITTTTTPQHNLHPRATDVLFPHDGSASSSTTTGFASSPSLPTSAPSRFPFIVKIEERRLPNPLFTPFCQRMRVLADGSTVPYMENGNPVVEVLKEAAPQKIDAQVTAGVVSGQSGHSHKGAYEGNGRYRRRDEVLWTGEFEVDMAKGVLRRRNQEPSNSCHCVWVSPFD
jgi:hypothetical protein